MSGKSTDNLGGIGRRTVVRAGAWSVPVVAVAVAAPALACSPVNSLAITAFSASYRDYLANTAQPTLIDVTSKATNSGSRPTSTYSRTLTIPANLFDSVTTSVPAGYVSTPAPTVAGSLATGWTITYQRSAPLAAHGTDNFSVTLTVGSTTANPYRGWQGPAFAMGYSANGGVTCNAPSSTYPVPATAVTTLAVTGWGAARSGSTLWIGTDTVNGPATTIVDNTGRKAVGPIFLDVTVPRQSSGRYQSVLTPANPGSVPTGWIFVSRTNNLDVSNNLVSWTYTFRTDPVTQFFAPDQLNGALTNHRTNAFRASLTLTGNNGSVDNPTNITAVARATGAATSPQVSNNSE